MAYSLIEGTIEDHTEEWAFDAPSLAYIDPPFYTGRDFGDFDDRWDSLDEYLTTIGRIIKEVSNVCEYNANIIVHIDPRVSHYVKVELDQLLKGWEFRNEIIWSYNSGGASKRCLAKKHDVLLWYSRGDDYTFNVMREPYATPNVEGRTGFNPEGRMLTDVWNIPIISTTAHERTGYATQKPIALMDRIVKIFSNEGDIVLDPVCGSGTTGVAAVNNDRKFIGFDINPTALHITKDRLDKALSM